jgi:tRNA (adenine22-N1)-methyltransferase
MKLSTRLNTLCQIIQTHEFEHIWDCCCDHGYLGQQLMAEHPNSQIHFVDVMPHLIDEVQTRLATQPQTNWNAQCIDAANIQLNTTQSHLVIIAGVGGDLLSEMVAAIVSNHTALISNKRLDFILCPVRQLHKVRESLNTLKLGLVSEQIVQDNHQFYEVIQVSNRSKTPVSLVGDIMWDLSNEQHQAYRNIMIAHYEKQPSDQAKYLLKSYLRL